MKGEENEETRSARVSFCKEERKSQTNQVFPQLFRDEQNHNKVSPTLFDDHTDPRDTHQSVRPLDPLRKSPHRPSNIPLSLRSSLFPSPLTRSLCYISHLSHQSHEAPERIRLCELCFREVCCSLTGEDEVKGSEEFAEPLGVLEVRMEEAEDVEDSDEGVRVKVDG